MKVSGPATPSAAERRSWLPVLQRLFRIRAEFSVGLDAKLGLQSLDRFARYAFSQDSHGLVLG